MEQRTTTCGDCGAITALAEYDENTAEWLCPTCYTAALFENVAGDWRGMLNDIRHAIDNWGTTGEYVHLSGAGRLARELAAAISEIEGNE